MTRVIVCRVGRLPVMEELERDPRGGHLSAMQKIVGGLIDCVSIEEGVDLWCNDEFAVLGLPFNRAIDFALSRVEICGDFLIARVDEEGDVVSATEDDFARYLELFDEEDVVAAQAMNEIRARRAAESES